MDNQLLDEFKEILTQVSGYRLGDIPRALTYVSKIFNPDTPTHELSRIKTVTQVMKFYHSLPPTEQQKLDSIQEQLLAILHERGYRDNILTYQEHQLIGSTVWIGYSGNPFKPIGLVEGELTIPEANTARLLEKCTAAEGEFFDIPQETVRISLEQLDPEGNIIRNPRLLDDMLNPLPETRYNPEFPYWKP